MDCLFLLCAGYLQEAVSDKRQQTLLTTLPQLSWTAEEINRRLDHQRIICVDKRRPVKYL